MANIASDIENRPKELWDLPNYGCLPDRGFQIDLAGFSLRVEAHFLLFAYISSQAQYLA